MVATNAALASGGITHCCLRCGLSMFFLASARSCCRWRARQCAVRRPSPRAGAGSNERNPPGPERGSARSILLLLRRRKSAAGRSEEHTSELQSRQYLVCRLLLEKKNKSVCQYTI